MTRRARLILCAAVVAVGTVQVGAAFSRSLIPYRLDGTLTQVETVSDSRQRIHEITVGGRTYEIDSAAVAAARLGRHVSKDRWSNVVWLDRRKAIRLGIGDETFQFAALVILATAAAWRLTRRD